MADVEKQLILLTGVPGAGKTTIGNAFESKRGFTHHDVEALRRLPDLKALPNKMIVTWGFVPNDPGSLHEIKKMIDIGFKMVWFDGNRAASKKAFISRNTATVSEYVTQIEKIDNSTILKTFAPTIINTFDEQGNFKTEDQIIEEVLSVIN